MPLGSLQSVQVKTTTCEPNQPNLSSTGETGVGTDGAVPSRGSPKVATLPPLSVAVMMWSSSELSGTMNFSVKLPLSSVVGELDTAISSYLMDTRLLAANPRPA